VRFAKTISALVIEHKGIAISLVVWVIVAAGGLLYFSAAEKPHKPQGAAPSSASTGFDLPGYFVAFERLAGRVDEQDGFVNSFKGKSVRWRGYVLYVRNSDVSQSKIVLAIAPTPGDARMALVYFGENMRERLFALREKDLVEISGTFDSEGLNSPYIQGRTIQLLRAATATPPTATTAQ